MGNGFFDGRKLHMVVSAQFLFTGLDEQNWKDALEEASQRLHTATLGQVQFGTVYLADEAFGTRDAEIALADSDTEESYGTRGLFGVSGAFACFRHDVKANPRLMVHELGHHLWDLGDEYAEPDVNVVIDRTPPATNLNTVPIDDGQVAANELVGGIFRAAFLVNGIPALPPRPTVTSNTTTLIQLDGDLPDFATNATSSGAVQFASSCGVPAQPNATHCIMAAREQPNVDSFCDETNHDTLTNSSQESLHGQSCWQTIVDHPTFSNLLFPGPSPTPALDPVNFVRLDKGARFALAIDISGSMSGDKLAYAKAGIVYWLERQTESADRVSVIAFNTEAIVALPLTSVSTTLDLAALIGTIDGLAAGGHTNVRDAIYEGIRQITDAPNVSAYQAVVVLTDGQHNRPLGTSVSETAGTLRDSKVTLCAIGIDGQENVDLVELNELAAGSNGFSSFIDVDEQTTSDVESALIEANEQLVGDVFELIPFDLVPPPPATRKTMHPKLRTTYGRKSHVSLKDVMRVLGTEWQQLTGRASSPKHLRGLITVHPFVVEAGCQSITAACNFTQGDSFDLWLVDPQSVEVSATSAGVRMTRDTSYPHRFCSVQKPQAGLWRAVLLRRESTPADRDEKRAHGQLTIGGTHREVTVVARARKALYSIGDSVVVEARASWGELLTNLRAELQIIGPGGFTRRVEMHDGGPISRGAGTYMAEFRGHKPGLYRGLVRVWNDGVAMRASGLHAVTHAPPNREINLRTPAGRFQRVVPISFEIVK